MRRERLRTGKRQPLTQTAHRTGHVTQPFIITLWTLPPAITHMIYVQTHWRSTTPEKSWTFCTLTALFILPVDAVIISITTSVGR